MEIWPDEILKATEGTPVMTQCEREGLYKKGAGVYFIITENSTLRFEINSTELEKERLKFPGTMLTNSTI